MAYFLRELYDSDGNHCKYKKRRFSQIHLYNNDKDLLRYVQHLLEKHFDIITTGPYINEGWGRERNGKTIKTKYDNYRINIYRKRCVQRFLDEIGFIIEEKQLGLPRKRR